VDYASVGSSGEKVGEMIKLEEVLPHFQRDFLLKKPLVWLVGGLVIHGETEGDIDILVHLPEDSPLAIRVPLEFRLYRALPEDLRDRLSVVYDNVLGPFTDFIELYDLAAISQEKQTKVEMSLRTAPGQKQTYNSPTFAYIAVYGKEPEQFLSGRSNDPHRIWNGLEVDIHLKDGWLEALNSIDGIEIRASCEGHSPERVSYIVFRNTDYDPERAREISARLSRTEACYSLADVGDQGKMRIVVAGKTWYGEKGWEDWWNHLAERIEKATSTEVKKLKLEEFRSSGIDEDLKHPNERYRELWAGLRYIGNAAYPRLSEGKKWGEWTLQDCLQYFAAIIDKLRSIYFPILDTEDGKKKNGTSWWKCYWDAKKYMKSSAPSEEETKKWNEKRKTILKQDSFSDELAKALEEEYFPVNFLEEAEDFLFQELIRAKFRATGSEGRQADKEAKQSQEEDKIVMGRRFYPQKTSISALNAYRLGEVYKVQSAIDFLERLYDRGIR
jgi:hypothetical protein